MDSIIEDKRSLHEERDRIELALVNEMLSKKSNHREKLDSEHRQKLLLDRFRKCSRKLLSLYQQEDSLQQLLHDPFVEFYSKLREIKDFYSKNSNEQVITLANEFEEIEAARQIAMGAQPKTSMQKMTTELEHGGHREDDDISSDNVDRDGEIMRLSKGLPTTDLVEIVEAPTDQIVAASKLEKQIEFTDEEGYGRYLDLTKCHEAFLQVIKKHEVKPSYLTFLDNFDKFNELQRELKLTSLYKTYLQAMLDYFRDYCRRARPLFDYEYTEKNVLADFAESWKKKEIPGWFRASDRVNSDLTPMIDLESYKSWEELAGLGLDCLKTELRARGLKCGGTLEDRAKRLWSVRGVSPDQIDPSLKALPFGDNKIKRKITIDPFHIASIEALLVMYADQLADHRQATIENVQRKQARTAEERNDSDEDLSDADDDGPDTNDIAYNPKNLPLGWDGKPIPYWLYKLHGLNMSFTCEICGNATYKGPKTFQRHFSEWRHAHGMRCLGIPNTGHFANITKIQDAISLWDKLKHEKQQNKFQPSIEEEFEDSQGNVVNKKTYEDLKRQGLL